MPLVSFGFLDGMLSGAGQALGLFCHNALDVTGAVLHAMLGTDKVTAMMLPYSITFAMAWTLFLLACWEIGNPFGLQARYHYG